MAVGTLPGELARLAVVRDPRLARVVWGAAWFGALAAAIFVGPEAVAVVFALVGGVAALQAAGRLRESGVVINQLVAAVGGAVVPLAAGIGTSAAGVALMVVAVAALAVGSGVARTGAPGAATAAGEDPASGAGAARAGAFDLWANAAVAWPTLRVALPIALAGTAVVVTQRIDEAALGFLVVAVCVYDAGSYLGGTSLKSRWVGPASGALCVVVWSLGMLFFEPPPLSGVEPLLAGVLLAVLCPAGELVGSALLPRATSIAPGLRRLDAWLLAAPAFTVILWLAA